MKILYLSQRDINFNKGGIYEDLIKALIDDGNELTLACADSGYDKTCLIKSDGMEKLCIKVANQFGANFIKKGLVLLELEKKMISAIKRHLKSDTFDMVLYATPPITLANVVKYVKTKYNCKSYLMLKDIFPQNAVDLGIMSDKGVLGFLYRYFRRNEKKLYALSDGIGCMSQANVEYLLRHNPFIPPEKVEIFPNAVSVGKLPTKDKSALGAFNIPSDKTVFIYGGNLGRPQGLDFLVEGIRYCRDLPCNFVIAGSGQEKNRLFAELSNDSNVYLLEYLPKEEYEALCAAADVGLIMLDKRFTIPNYPSRVLAYMANAIPVLTCTDAASDIGTLVEDEARCGKKCLSGDLDNFRNCIRWFCENPEALEEMGLNGRRYLVENFNTDVCVEKLRNFIQSDKID